MIRKTAQDEKHRAENRDARDPILVNPSLGDADDLDQRGVCDLPERVESADAIEAGPVEKVSSPHVLGLIAAGKSHLAADIGLIEWVSCNDPIIRSHKIEDAARRQLNFVEKRLEMIDGDHKQDDPGETSIGIGEPPAQGDLPLRWVHEFPERLADEEFVAKGAVAMDLEVASLRQAHADDRMSVTIHDDMAVGIEHHFDTDRPGIGRLLQQHPLACAIRQCLESGICQLRAHRKKSAVANFEIERNVVFEQGRDITGRQAREAPLALVCLIGDNREDHPDRREA